MVEAVEDILVLHERGALAHNRVVANQRSVRAGDALSVYLHLDVALERFTTTIVDFVVVLIDSRTEHRNSVAITIVDYSVEIDLRLQELSGVARQNRLTNGNVERQKTRSF